MGKLSSVLMILCLLLSGCGSCKQQVEQARKRITDAPALGMTAQVQADYGETVERYTLDCQFDGETWTVTVLAPEAVAGIVARISEDASELEYDGAILTTGDLMGKGIAPISAVPMMLETLKVGTLDTVWSEGEGVAGRFIYDDAIDLSVWFDGLGTPVAAELSEHGITKANCTLTNVWIKEVRNGSTEETNLGGNSPEQSGA